MEFPYCSLYSRIKKCNVDYYEQLWARGSVESQKIAIASGLE